LRLSQLGDVEKVVSVLPQPQTGTGTAGESSSQRTSYWAACCPNGYLLERLPGKREGSTVSPASTVSFTGSSQPNRPYRPGASPL